MELNSQNLNLLLNFFLFWKLVKFPVNQNPIQSSWLPSIAFDQVFLLSNKISYLKYAYLSPISANRVGAHIFQVEDQMIPH